jgi:phage recombination protein Bet
MAETTKTTAVATTTRKSITATVADRYGMEPDAFEQTLRKTVFKEGSREEFAAFLVVANEHHLNPLTKEIFGFKGKSGGIQAVVSVDGWARIINEHPQMDGFEFIDHKDNEGQLEAITCRMFRKDRAHPGEATEYMAECVMDKDTWKKWPRRMLRHKALIQAARYTFGFAGIVDEDEYERIVSVETLAGPRPSMSADFPADGQEGSQTGDQGAGADDSQNTGEGAGEASGGVQDAEFEEVVDQKTGEVTERPQEEGKAAQGAETAKATAASATDASGGSAAATSSQPQPEQQSKGGGENVKTGHAAPGEVYFLAGEKPMKSGKRSAYMDGTPYDSVPAAQELPVYAEHSPETDDDAEAEGLQGASEAQDRLDKGDIATETLSQAFTHALEAVSVAPHYLAAKQVLRTLAGADDWKKATDAAKALTSKALWNRFVELRDAGSEQTPIISDWTLMGLWLDHGATSQGEIDAMWRQFWKSELYKKANQPEQLVITERMQTAKERVGK